MNRPNSTAENVPKIAELKLSNCGLEVADFRKDWNCGIAELRLWSNISLKVAELRLRKCFLQVAELRSQKKVARALLCVQYSFSHKKLTVPKSKNPAITHLRGSMFHYVCQDAYLSDC
jgi:hypothetical protein